MAAKQKHAKERVTKESLPRKGWQGMAAKQKSAKDGRQGEAAKERVARKGAIYCVYTNGCQAKGCKGEGVKENLPMV